MSEASDLGVLPATVPPVRVACQIGPLSINHLLSTSPQLRLPMAPSSEELFPHQKDLGPLPLPELADSKRDTTPHETIGR